MATPCTGAWGAGRRTDLSQPPDASEAEHPGPPLEAVPNVSEGENEEALAAIGRGFASSCDLLDVHFNPDYGRSVFTMIGGPQALAESILSGARIAIQRLDIHRHRGVHPCIGVIDVVPIAYLRSEDRPLAHAEALAVANRLGGELELPVFLYGELATAPERRERAYFRGGGIEVLDSRLESRELEPDFGPPRAHPTAGATLVAARPPLVAFNLELSTSDEDKAKAIAARVREGGERGLEGVRAIGVALERQGVVQLSANVHDPFAVPLRRLVEAVAEEAGRAGIEVVAAELVGLAPEAALEGFPKNLPLRGFDPGRHLLENRLGSARGGRRA